MKNLKFKSPNMKNREHVFYCAFSLIVMISALSGTILKAAEITTIDKVITITRELPSFYGVEAGGIFNVMINIGQSQEVKIEVDENQVENVITEVVNDILYIKGDKLKNSAVNVYITIPELRYLKASGAVTFKVNGMNRVKEMKLIASGAANVDMNGEIDHFLTDISGAADVKVNGKAVWHKSELSGAGSLKASELETDTLIIFLSGAAEAIVNVKDMAVVEQSGAAHIKYTQKPPVLTNVVPPSAQTKFDSNNNGIVNLGGDSVVVDLGKVKIKVDEDEGVSTIKIGKQELIVDEDGNVHLKKEKKPHRFEGHWGGFDLSLNGYLNSDWNMDFGGANRYLDLNMPKSVGVHLNAYEQNIKISHSGNFGFITGLGIEWHNYRFDQGVYLDEKAHELNGYLVDGVRIKKNKLMIRYLTVPVLFEFQHDGDSKLESYHFTAGLLLGARIGSHTKTVYAEQLKEYQLIDPATGEIWKTMISPRQETEKVHDDFNLNPFKADVMVRVGWGYINLFGTYSLTTLFRNNRGPELYPFSVGLTLIGW